jgi:hypothetical protein
LAFRVFGGKKPQFPTPKRLIAQGEGGSDRSWKTIVPLSILTGIHIERDCSRDDRQCTIELINKFDTSPTMVVWQHKMLTSFVEEFTGVSLEYPKKHYDFYWMVDTIARTVKVFFQDCLI